jgi:hypothetical protein
VRCLSGETKKLGALAKTLEGGQTTPVVMTGPYGERVVEEGVTNVLGIAGGTGISFPLPLVMDVLERRIGAAVQLVWVVRHARDLEWIASELYALKEEAKRASSPLTIKIFVTREPDNRSTVTEIHESKTSESSCCEKKAADHITSAISVSSSSSVALDQKLSLSGLLSPQRGFEVNFLDNKRPNLEDVVRDYLATGTSGMDVEGKVQVVASGPSSMGSDLRTAVAQVNDAGKAWKGTGRAGDIGFYWDDRMG